MYKISFILGLFRLPEMEWKYHWSLVVCIEDGHHLYRQKTIYSLYQVSIVQMYHLYRLKSPAFLSYSHAHHRTQIILIPLAKLQYPEGTSPSWKHLSWRISPCWKCILHELFHYSNMVRNRSYQGILNTLTHPLNIPLVL